MALDTTDTIKGLIYEGVAFTLDDGEDMLQARVDATDSCSYLFYNYSGTELDISRLDTSNATNMYGMFQRCSSLTSLDLSNFDTSNVTTMYSMFEHCSRLTSLDLSNFNTSNVREMYYMFNNCSKLTSLNVSNFNTSKVTNMGNMFQSCSDLTNLDLSSFNTTNVTSMRMMFAYCSSLITLDLSNFNTSKVTDMVQMFLGCGSLTSLDLSNFNTSKARDMSNMFNACSNLPTIQGTLDLYSATSVSNIFNNTQALIGVTLKNIRKTLQIGSGTSYGHLWELSYLINAIKECWDLTDSTQQTLTIGSANLEKIANTYVRLIVPTAEQIEADPYINNKLPCEVCESTDEGAMTLTAYAGLKNWVLA